MAPLASGGDRKKSDIYEVYGGLHAHLRQGFDAPFHAGCQQSPPERPWSQVFFEIVMVGNLAEKSFAFAATVIATLRATAL